jgi:hypothetical protein
VVMGGEGDPAVRAAASAPASGAALLGQQVAAELLRRGAGKYMTMSGVYSSDGDDA